MSHDPTESVRRVLVTELNNAAGSREELAANYGQVWSTDQLTTDFEVLSFRAPFVSVKRRSDGQHGLLIFQHSPRYYWGFQPT